LALLSVEVLGNSKKEEKKIIIEIWDVMICRRFDK
jgi:hypothetical protein